MQQTNQRPGRSRLVIAIVLGAVLAAGGVAAGVVLANRNYDSARTEAAVPAPTPVTGASATISATPSADVLSAAEGAAARSRRTQFQPLAATAKDMGGKLAAASASLGAIDDKPAPAQCGSGEGDSQPSPDDIASANADTEALAGTLRTYGIAYTRSTDGQGYLSLDWDYNDVVAQSVSDSYWANRYPSQPPSQAELDQVKAENDAVARHLDTAGIAYTRTRDAQGWENVEYDYDNPAAQKAVDDAYTELYPPVPPSAEELAITRADNDRQAAAFDAAGIAYRRVSDELGWEWLERRMAKAFSQ